MRVLKTKWFARFARKQRISDGDLIACIERIEDGHVDADLGGGLVKQRIARPGEGRAGGFRMIIVFRSGELACFVSGFAKKDQANLDAAELAALKSAARDVLSLDRMQLSTLVDAGELIEVMTDDQAI